jgi:hypothetical protein
MDEPEEDESCVEGWGGSWVGLMEGWKLSSDRALCMEEVTDAEGSSLEREGESRVARGLSLTDVDGSALRLTSCRRPCSTESSLNTAEAVFVDRSPSSSASASPFAALSFSASFVGPSPDIGTARSSTPSMASSPAGDDASSRSKSENESDRSASGLLLRGEAGGVEGG